MPQHWISQRITTDNYGRITQVEHFGPQVAVNGAPAPHNAPITPMHPLLPVVGFIAGLITALLIGLAAWWLLPHSAFAQPNQPVTSTSTPTPQVQTQNIQYLSPMTITHNIHVDPIEIRSTGSSLSGTIQIVVPTPYPVKLPATGDGSVNR